MLARAEREHQLKLVRATGRDDVSVRTHRRVDRVDAAVDQRVRAGAGDVGDLGRLEVARRRRGRARDPDEREVVRRVVARARRAEEEREAVVDVVGRHEHVGQRVGQPGVAEVAVERGVQPVVLVALVDEPLDREDALEQAAAEDPRALLDVDPRELVGAVERRVRPGPGRVSPQARIPPVDVPATRSTISAIRRPVRRSISASTSAGIRPRMPPPSMQRTFTGRESSFQAARPGGNLPDL